MGARGVGGDTLMDMARAERAELAAFLSTLSAEQWATQSLCERWTVKDVVAHMISYEDLDTFGLMKRFAKGYVVRANQVGVDEIQFSQSARTARLSQQSPPTARTDRRFRRHDRPR
jgi:uncharacterized protein (TIGR03083 family)